MICVSTAKCPATGPENAPIQQAPLSHTKPEPEPRRPSPLATTPSTLEECQFHGKLQPQIDQGTTYSQQSPAPRPQAHSSQQNQLQGNQRQAQTSCKVARLSHKFADVLEVRCDCQNNSTKSLVSDKINVKGRLRDHSQFWVDIGASSIVLSH